MTKVILAFFSSSGTPSTGLSPTIRIRVATTGTLVVTDEAMTEVGDGFYRYSFTTYDEDASYSIRADGGAGLSASDRYVYAGNDNFVDDIWDAQIADHDVVGSMASEIRASHGGAYGSSGKNMLGLEEAKTIAELVWKVILDGKREAKEVLLTRSDFDAIKDKVLLKDKIEFPKVEFPKMEPPVPIDLEPFSTGLARIEKKVDAIPTKQNIQVLIPESMAASMSEIKGQLTEVKSLAPKVDQLNLVLEELKNKKIDLSSVDNLRDLVMASEPVTEERLADLLVEMNDQQTMELREILKLILVDLKAMKYDMLKK